MQHNTHLLIGRADSPPHTLLLLLLLLPLLHSAVAVAADNISQKSVHFPENYDC